MPGVDVISHHTSALVSLFCPVLSWEDARWSGASAPLSLLSPESRKRPWAHRCGIRTHTTGSARWHPASWKRRHLCLAGIRIKGGKNGSTGSLGGTGAEGSAKTTEDNRQSTAVRSTGLITKAGESNQPKQWHFSFSHTTGDQCTDQGGWRFGLAALRHIERVGSSSGITSAGFRTTGAGEIHSVKLRRLRSHTDPPQPSNQIPSSPRYISA
ncbi:hypothetical protein BDP55DRAFT_633853 [Colletotrichum godetiae]|uniref:Uncharacterized protein n=1 Tax=Colletotrichum godetiae TaxID=1209918 RepID=A0AAJ0AHX7_9PEZI|nr:uncharacterized protein BDP55DRAFT_633853 [Colletotrichum godetiae]KAK1673574.1 hypothetical protein BDP55DRAFT_633853 [Colletotrichum godetiae]